MEIFGFGSGHGGYGRRNERREAFRRKHAVGQRVVGTFLKWQSPSLAWVEVGGHPLLAQLGGAPREGQKLFFIIKELQPDIVLQEFTPAMGGSALAEHAQVFWSGRTGFETLLLGHATPLLQEKTPSARHERFLSLLAEDAPFQAAWDTLKRDAAVLDTLMQARGAGRLLLMPWLMPRAREQEMLLVAEQGDADSLRRLLFSFTLPALGACEVRVLLRPPKGRYRVFMERPEHASCLSQHLDAAALAAAGFELEPAGVGHLQPGLRGVIAPLLRMEAEHSVPRFSTRV